MEMGQSAAWSDWWKESTWIHGNFQVVLGLSSPHLFLEGKDHVFIQLCVSIT